MTDKELKRLNRRELLEMLIEQSKELESTSKKLSDAETRLASREITVSETGTLAAASLKLSGIFDAADAAAAQYIENARIRSERAQAEADKITGDAAAQAEEKKAEAERVLNDARAEAERITKEAQEAAGKILDDAGMKAEGIISRAQTVKLRKMQHADEYLNEINRKLSEYFKKHPELQPALEGELPDAKKAAVREDTADTGADTGETRT